jgi:hypothetical protein
MRWAGYKTVSVAIRSVAVACVLGAIALTCGPCASMIAQVWKAQQAKERLLCQTDYQALRDAGRELLRQLGGKDAVYRVSDQPQSPEVQQFPKVILDLAPQAILVDTDGHMVISMFANGFLHCSAHVYAEDFEKAHPGGMLGNRMLVEGLWYCDDEYVTDPHYDKVIDKLVEEGKRKQK